MNAAIVARSKWLMKCFFVGFARERWFAVKTEIVECPRCGRLADEYQDGLCRACFIWEECLEDEKEAKYDRVEVESQESE